LTHIEFGKGEDDVIASGRHIEEQDIPNLCTEFESVNDDWGPVSRQLSRPGGKKRVQAKDRTDDRNDQLL